MANNTIYDYSSSDIDEEENEPEGWEQGEEDHGDIRSQYSYKPQQYEYSDSSDDDDDDYKYCPPNDNVPHVQKQCNMHINDAFSSMSIQSFSSSDYVQPGKVKKPAKAPQNKIDLVHNNAQNSRNKPKVNQSKMRYQNINGFNAPNYNKQPTVSMTVRMPTENIREPNFYDIDLINIIKQIQKKKKEGWNEHIAYNEILLFLEFEYPHDCEHIAHHFNDLLFDEMSEGYIKKIGKIGTKDCKLQIIRDRKLQQKEMGKVLSIKNGKYFKAITYDSRILSDECETIEEAKDLLLKQPRFEPFLNWKNNQFVAIQNFKRSFQIFRSLESEIDASHFSLISELHLLPIVVIEALKDLEIETFADYMDRFEKNKYSLHSIKQLIGEDGLCQIYEKIQFVMRRMETIHAQDNDWCYRGILKSKYPKAIIVGSNKNEIECINCQIVHGINEGSIVSYEIDQYQRAFNVRRIDNDMIGFANYVDIIAMSHEESILCDNKLDLNKWTLCDVIEEELKYCDTFSMHDLPLIIEHKLGIIWHPQKFGFQTLRQVFEDKDVKRVCRLDNASSTALVSTPAKSREVPSMDWVKNGFVNVLQKHGDPQRGYRMKGKGKGSDIRAHFARINNKALKPKVWYGMTVKELIRKCEDVIRVDTTTEADGVWLLFLK